MSLESKLDGLIMAVNRLADAISAGKTATVAPTAAPVQAVPTPAAPTVAAPASTTVPVAAAPSAVAPSGTPVVMPSAPSFTPPVAAAAVVGAPFSDGKGLIDYVMSSYKALGPQKGAQIQSVLTGLGYQNINDVKPEHYGALFSGVEALKGA